MGGTLSSAALLALLAAELLGPNNAIFFGGGGDGYASSSVVATGTNQIFGGGDGDGYSSSTFVAMGSNQIFGGGDGDGYSSWTLMPATTNQVFGGGDGDGYAAASFDPGEFLFDWGDAPDPTYPTLASSSGARHVIDGGLWLGIGVDAETDGQPSGTATGDDGDGNDDEDGVVFDSLLIAGGPATVTVTASDVGELDAWIDFNRDGDWLDPGEQIFTSTAVSLGANILGFSVPAVVNPGSAFARFRLSTAGGLAPDGPALDGEVEDYEVSLFLNVPLVADAGVDRTTSNGNDVNLNTESVMLGGSPAASGGVPPYTYQWTLTPDTGFNLSDATAPNPVFTGTALGTFTAKLEITDDNSTSDTDSVLIDVVCPSQLDIFNTVLTGPHLLEATNTVTLEQVLIGSGAVVHVIAGQQVVFLEGVQVEDGVELSVSNDPGADCQ